MTSLLSLLMIIIIFPFPAAGVVLILLLLQSTLTARGSSCVSCCEEREETRHDGDFSLCFTQASNNEIPGCVASLLLLKRLSSSVWRPLYLPFFLSLSLFPRIITRIGVLVNARAAASSCLPLVPCTRTANERHAKRHKHVCSCCC